MRVYSTYLPSTNKNSSPQKQEAVGYELLQNPKNDSWYLKNELLKIRPVYVEQFENKSKTRVKRNYSLPGYCLVQNIFLQMTCIVYSTKLYRVLPCNEEIQLRPNMA